MVDKINEEAVETEVEETETSRTWMKPVIIAVALVSIVAASFFLAKGFILPAYQEYQVKQEIEAQEESIISGNEMGLIYVMDNFTVNTLGSNGRRYVIAEFAVEVSQSDLLTELETKEPVIRDEFIAYFRGQTIVDVLDNNFQQNSRNKLMSILNKNLYTGQIDSLYYLKLLLQ